MPNKKEQCEICQLNRWETEFAGHKGHAKTCMYCHIEGLFRKRFEELEKENGILRQEFSALREENSSLRGKLLHQEEKEKKKKTKKKTKRKKENQAVAVPVAIVASNTENRESEWETVKKGKGAKPKLPTSTVVKTSNRFGLLSSEEESALLVGDSLTRGQEKYFGAVGGTKRSVKCFPGARNTKLANEIEKLKVKDRKMPIIANVSGNDLFLRPRGTGNTEDVLHDAGLMIDELKQKTDNGIMIGILPRKCVSNYALSKAISVNWRLQDMCVPHGIRFVDPYDVFYGRSELFTNDGVHLSHRGKIVYGDMVNQVLRRVIHSNPNRPVTKKTETSTEAPEGHRSKKCPSKNSKAASEGQEVESSTEEQTGPPDSEGSALPSTPEQSGNE